MKKSISVLTLLLISSLYPQVNIDIDNLLERSGLLYAPNKEKPYSGSVFNLFDNGEYEFKGRYRSGLKHGKWTWWNLSGMKRKEVIWQKGEEINLIEWEYFNGGQLSNERHYKEDEKDGKWISWYENGQKKFEKKYKKGEPNGVWNEWYENGQKEVEAYFNGGKRDRHWAWWYENGQKKKEINYKNDEIVGIWTSWDEKAEIVWEGTIAEYRAEEARKAEVARLAEEARIAAKEKARKEEEFRQAEAMRLATEEEARKAEVARLAEEARLDVLELFISVSTTIPLPDESISIQWNKPTPVKIYYIIDRHRTIIHHSIGNEKKYVWRVPEFLEDKRISIEIEEVGNEKNKDKINIYVRVKSKPLITKKESNFKSATNQLSIKVGKTSPSVEEVISIQWNILKPVRISYRLYGQRILIYTSTKNIQTYFWKIPKILAGDIIDLKAEEIGNEENYDTIFLSVQSTSTSSLTKGPSSITNIKKQKQKSNDYLKNLFVSSNEKILRENGYYFSFNYPNIIFINSNFNKKIKDGTIKRYSAGGLGFEFKESPHIFSTEVNMVSFETVLDTNIIYFTSIDANYRYSFLNINNVSPSIGFGYQESDISIWNDEFGDNSGLKTSGLYLIGDLKIGYVTDKKFTMFGDQWTSAPKNGIGIGTSFKRSIGLGDLNWDQSNIYLYLFGDWALIPCAFCIAIIGGSLGM